jgi:DNA-binding beta-propeller fold protein YncE
MLRTISRLAAGGLLLTALVASHERPSLAQAAGGEMPVFEKDTSWPKIPNNWVLGAVPAVATDRRDHVWILHRPRLVPEAQRAQAAPAVLEYDANGNFVRAWGGPSDAYEWPSNEHGITVDHKNNIWISGNGITDDMLLKFTLEGKFIAQYGKRGASTGNADTVNVNRPADLYVYPKTNELFVADGYGNRRLIVFDADTGKFKRMWGAFGKPPDSNPPAGAPGAARGRGDAAGGRGEGAGAPAAAGDPAARAGGGGGRGGRGAQNFDTEGPGPDAFTNPVHAVKVSNDGLVYVGDRGNRRIQVFTLDGKFVTQGWVNRGGPGGSSTAGIAFSPDSAQRFLYNASFGDARIAVLDRKSLQVLYQFGDRGTQPSQIVNAHLIAVNSKGDIYVSEVMPGNRAHRFVFKGMSKTIPANANAPVAVAPAAPAPAK